MEALQKTCPKRTGQNPPRVRCFLLLLCLLPALATDPALHAQLHQQVRTGAKVVPYSSGSKFDTSDALAILDATPGDTNTVRLIYAHTTLPAANFGDTGGWNREHLWPNSYGLDDVEPAFSDLHNLRACDSNVNSARGNKWFDRSTDENFKNPAHVEAPLCTTDYNSWEPPADQRGDIARAVFYMDVRYDGEVPGEPDLVLIEEVEKINANAAFMGRLSTLLHWNVADPPDDAERARDAGVKAIQGNANPFVADPFLANRLYLPRIAILPYHDGSVGFALAESQVGRLSVVLEYAPTPSGPWSANQDVEASSQFARVRLLE